jgi:hypothetical protein
MTGGGCSTKEGGANKSAAGISFGAAGGDWGVALSLFEICRSVLLSRGVSGIPGKEVSSKATCTHALMVRALRK